MSADKRSVATDALETLGTIIGENEKRDAIHLAVEPVIAAHNMDAGAHVGLMSDGRASELTDKKLGIVDPFLPSGVVAGEKFWLVVYLRQITSLRHVWEHPDFPTSPDVMLAPKYGVSEQWIRDFAEQLGLTYTDLMDGASDWIRWGSYLNRGGLLEGEHVPDVFWSHYETVTGEQVKESDRGTFFTCSC